jgi:hypothetical protein
MNEGAVLLLPSALDRFQFQLENRLAKGIVPWDRIGLKMAFFASPLVNFVFGSWVRAAAQKVLLSLLKVYLTEERPPYWE